MTDTALRVLLDTNVWLDLFIPNRRNGRTARRLLSFCAKNEAGIVVLFPMHALDDTFYQVAREAKAWVRESIGALPEAYARAANAQAWDCIDKMAALGTPVGADGSDVWLAQHLREVHADFEDNMVLAAAMRAKADYLVTSDQQLIQKATVAALTPQDMLKVLEIHFGRVAS